MVKTSKNYWRRKPEGPWRAKEEKENQEKTKNRKAKKKECDPF
jgi:hypothetical protein